MTPSTDVCTLQSKYFNADTIKCETWADCSDINYDLDNTQNECKKQARTAQYCTENNYFWFEGD